jgi:hypothetical protein
MENMLMSMVTLITKVERKRWPSSKVKSMPTPIGNYYTVMFTYMAMDIFHNNQEMTKRIMKKRLYSMVFWWQRNPKRPTYKLQRT